MKNDYGKILLANMVSRTGIHKKRVREDIESEYGFPYWKKLNTGTGSRKGRNEKRLREDFESGYGCPYWKKLNTGTDSRTRRYEKLIREDIASGYGFPIWCPVLGENKYGYAFPYCSHGHIDIYKFVYISI